MTTDTQPRQHVYRGRGTWTEQALSCADPGPALCRVPTIADQIPITQIMTREITCARPDLELAKLVELMVQNRIGCVPVVAELGRPIGMVTKLDLVEHQLGAPARRTAPCTAGEMMMSLALTLNEHATVAHAAALMATEDVHHVPICDASGRMIGIVSTMDVVRWLADNDGFVPSKAAR